MNKERFAKKLRKAYSEEMNPSDWVFRVALVIVFFMSAFYILQIAGYNIKIAIVLNNQGANTAQSQ